MSNDTHEWKKKYLALLDQHEHLESGFSQQTELLKRALIRSSLAAEGNDPQLDQQLQLLRTLLRKDLNNYELEQHIDQLEAAVLKSETNLQQRKDMLSTTLSHFVQQLQQLQPPKDVTKELKAFEKSLQKQLNQPYNTYNVIQQLQQLQSRAISANTEQNESSPAGESTPGLFARLFKSNNAAPQPITLETEVDTSSTTASAAEHCVITTSELFTQPIPEEARAAADTIETAEVAEVAEVAEPSAVSSDDNELFAETDSSYTLPQLSETPYSAVAQHIHTTLTELLNELPVTDRHELQAASLRERIDQGLNWYELAPLLDELSLFIIALTSGTDSELEQYLLELNQRLATFYETLQETSSGYSESVKDAQVLDNDLREHVTSFHDDIHTSTDLDDLKKLVDTRLDRFISTLQVYQEKRERNDSAILERFATMTAYSQQMEQEAQLLTQKLEEQRQKALLDPLTGLANRAAWNERSELEHDRIQRTDTPLLLSIIDIDHFKRVNDSYGHLAGDKVLKIIANELKKRLRKTDFIARFGGEEYALLLPDTPLQSGYELIETLRLAIEACPFHFKGEPVTITFSAGIGQVCATETLDQAFERIDQALYSAKKSGRNQTQYAQDTSH